MLSSYFHKKTSKYISPSHKTIKLMNNSSSINIADYTCSICREIFQSPVSLSCPHAYCQSCIIGLRKHPSTSTTSESNPVSSLRSDKSLGFVRYRELENELNTLETSCSNCSTIFTLSELRKHLETCESTAAKVNRRKSDSKPIARHLSESQADALKRAQAGENRSTFECPFCARANFTLSHLRQHIKKRHLGEDQHRVCPICSSMPWGDKTMISSNIYQHIKNRHQFDYDTYVNYEKDEEAMIREAMQASLVDH
ncbi:unnamed protein product [Rotaria socialis]